jgi:hypothetical protein
MNSKSTANMANPGSALAFSALTSKLTAQTSIISGPIFHPAFRNALIITMSDYNPENPCEWGPPAPLPASKNDGRAMEVFLKTKCGFKVEILENMSKDVIDKRITKLVNSATVLQDVNSKGLYFVYYSGHGKS